MKQGDHVFEVGKLINMGIPYIIKNRVNIDHVFEAPSTSRSDDYQHRMDSLTSSLRIFIKLRLTNNRTYNYLSDDDQHYD